MYQWDGRSKSLEKTIFRQEEKGKENVNQASLLRVCYEWKNKLLQGEATIFATYWNNPIECEILIFHDTARVITVIGLLSK